MKWQKEGLIYAPDGYSSWAKHSALQPTPILMDGFIRVFIGLRDEGGVSRVGFVDLDPDKPSRILGVSKHPVLDIGDLGTFDENGVVPCAVVRRDEKLFLYYAGYRLDKKVKFFVFGGLSVSQDGGNSFQRLSKVPITDRTDNELFFRVIHSVLFKEDHWKVWYGGGSEFIEYEGRSLPSYNIRYMVSKDGMTFGKEGQVVVSFSEKDEYRVGRPYVIEEKGRYQMFFAKATKSKGYRLGYAESEDGVHWIRKDEAIWIDVSPKGWDFQMISYPSILSVKNRTYLFYNGNEMGKSGFGYAVRVCE